MMDVTARTMVIPPDLAFELCMDLSVALCSWLTLCFHRMHIVHGWAVFGRVGRIH
jgi:hypothetical protein